MWYYLDKRDRPIETVKGRPFSNFIRILLHWRKATTERPDCMYPCWICQNCGYVEDYVGGHRDDGNVCPKCNKAFLSYIEKRYKPLTPGLTQGGSKNPPNSPRPDIKIPSQVAKREETRREKIARLRGDVRLLQCQRVAMGLLTDDIDPVEGDKDWSAALEAVKDLRAERDELCAKMRQLCQGIEMGIPEPPDHVCGNPDSMCDSDCADYANWYELVMECGKLSKARG